jgi:hypothetical protein
MIVPHADVIRDVRLTFGVVFIAEKAALRSISARANTHRLTAKHAMLEGAFTRTLSDIDVDLIPSPLSVSRAVIAKASNTTLERSKRFQHFAILHIKGMTC